MDKRIRELYKTMAQTKNGMDEVSKEIYEKIMELTREEKKAMDWKEYEQYRDKLFLIASIAEEGGFINGFKYAVRLIAECYTEQRDITAKP